MKNRRYGQVEEIIMECLQRKENRQKITLIKNIYKKSS